MHIAEAADTVPAQPQSGRHVIHTGIYMPFAQGTALGLHTNYTLLPGYLKKLGYSTHMVGKWCAGPFSASSSASAVRVGRPWSGTQAPRAEYTQGCAHGKRIRHLLWLLVWSGGLLYS
eukprot:SAG31_NODE_10569_length_1123_cov_1.301758_2_plen_117_part_01